jgi:hypothetical protein
MNSFIFSFRPLVAALVTILCIEAVTYIAVRPNFAERSNYLGYNYLSPEQLHKGIIYEKLREFGNSAPDIVQVGDSSGLHNVIPEIVERYLGGLKYVNMSCCANTGFDGYYVIAKSILDRDRNAKALVLYISLKNLPAVDNHNGDELVGGATNLYDTYASPWSVAWPPTMALRPDVTAAVYSLGGLLGPEINQLDQIGTSVIARHWLDAHGGWWPEDDQRFTAGNPDFDLCGPSDTTGPNLAPNLPNSRFYTTGILGSKRFYSTEVFEHFADLAADHGARLVIAFQPQPCAHIDADALSILNASLAEVVRERPNVVVVPKSIFGHWPAAQFTGLSHMRVGYETANSEQLGQLLAAALGLKGPQVAPDRNYAIDADANTPDVWSLKGPPKDWYRQGVNLRVGDNGTETLEATEQPGALKYHFETTIPNLEPGKPYIFSLVVKPKGAGAISLVLRDLKSPGQLAGGECDFRAGSGYRTQLAFDSDIEALPDGWWRCWVSVLICDNRAVVGVDIHDDQQTPVDAGKRGLLIREARVQPGWRLAPETLPPLPPIIPFGQRCP